MPKKDRDHTPRIAKRIYEKLEMWGEDELHGMAPQEIMNVVAERLAGSAGLRLQVGMRLEPRKPARILNGR